MTMRKLTGRDGDGRRGKARWWSAALAVVLGTAGGAAAKVHTFEHEHVLGTSLQLMVAAPSQAAAKAAEKAVLAEVARLDRIVGTYRADSEVNRLAAATGTRKCSPELLDVLEACGKWQQASGGAFNAQLGEAILLWQQAERDGRLPDASRLAAAVKQAQQPAFQTDHQRDTVTWLRAQKINLDALAKGYIVDQAVAAAAKKVPEAEAILLNVGGDIRAWNRSAKQPARHWPIRIANPARPAENAAALSSFDLANGAVATSGSYARYRTIDGTRHSCILDGRTGRPVTHAVSATVVAPDCVTADALATICMVLPPDEGVRMVRTVAGAECLLVAADGTRRGTGRWKAPSASPASPAKGGAWPDGQLLRISLTLTKTRERPMAAFWIENADGKVLRTLSVWMHKSKYLTKLPAWYGQWRTDPPIARGAVTRATPAPGTHTVVWDGKDHAGKPVPGGTYTVRIELYERKDLRNRHIDLKAKVLCGVGAADVALPDRGYAKDIRITYGE